MQKGLITPAQMISLFCHGPRSIVGLPIRVIKIPINLARFVAQFKSDKSEGAGFSWAEILKPARPPALPHSSLLHVRTTDVLGERQLSEETLSRLKQQLDELSHDYRLGDAPR